MVARVVGTAGAVLRSIEERCQARVELSSTGTVHVHGSSRERAEAAQRAVMDASGESLAAGEAYWARVVGLKDFGAMVQMEDTGVACLLHISEISTQRVKSVGDALAMGDRVRVLCQGRDDRGNIKISRKALLAGKSREGGEGA
ncbi:hypothetical protein H632_c424p1 [Helicosporidium sp. ATCC 50920]|nr:hypothetical protein H632_c424p1 [Helicosporidium sp. ATCC 50920]|eukprot:KDD75946.1 hypothetical protein H632_c424p1 [Helicosporidium sp. ATCC 50920]